jgi:peptidyl-prolyl cis-trans isomerase D
MLQAIRDTLGRWVAGVILGLLALAFIFWGVDFNLTGATYAAKVNGENIPLQEFDRALQLEQSQYAELYRAELNEELRSELRRNVIERLVRTTALRQHVEDEGYRASDERLLTSIRAMPAFQVGGEFSMDLYRARLLNEGLVPTWFEVEQRASLALADLQAGISDSAFLTPSEARRYIELFGQRRQIAYALFGVQSFLEPEAISDEQIAAHYEVSRELYRTEEMVDLEYVRLRQADLAAGIEISDADIEAIYAENSDAYRTPEERHARHILVAAQGENPEAAARAEAILQRLQAGEEFATLAGELSEDPGTRAAGGDLGWIARGMLVGPFEDTLFGMTEGETRGPVATQFGYHIIRLDEIRPESVQTFEQAREQLRSEHQQRRAEELFYERANELTERSFDAFDELASVATEMGLSLSTLSGFPRSGDLSQFENSAPVVQAAFSDEALQQRANSALIELAADDVLVLRVTAHYPSVPKPLADVREQIRLELAQVAAQQRASQAATDLLVELGNGAAPTDPAVAAAAHGATWVEPRWVTRSTADVPTEILAGAFRLPKLTAAAPQREGVALANGDQAVLVLMGIEAGQAENVPEQEREAALEQLTSQMGLYELSAYATEIRSEASVQIPDLILNPPPQF